MYYRHVYLIGYHIRNVQLTSGAMNVYIAQNAQVGQDPPVFVLEYW